MLLSPIGSIFLIGVLAAGTGIGSVSETSNNTAVLEVVARGDRIYPKLAQRKGIEGRVEVAIDTDEQGNVTDVRLTRSSGNSELDEKHLRLVWQWKLKPTPGGRQGVPILKCLLLSRGIKVRNLIVSIDKFR